MHFTSLEMYCFRTRPPGAATVCDQIDDDHPANKRHLPNDSLMLDQRLRRSRNIKPALAERLVLSARVAGLLQHREDVGDDHLWCLQ